MSDGVKESEKEFGKTEVEILEKELDEKVKIDLNEDLNDYQRERKLRLEDLELAVTCKKLDFDDYVERRKLNNDWLDSAIKCNKNSCRHSKIYEEQYERAVVSSEKQTEAWESIAVSLLMIANQMSK